MKILNSTWDHNFFDEKFTSRVVGSASRRRERKMRGEKRGWGEKGGSKGKLKILKAARSPLTKKLASVLCLAIIVSKVINCFGWANLFDFCQYDFRRAFQVGPSFDNTKENYSWVCDFLGDYFLFFFFYVILFWRKFMYSRST